MAKKEVVLAEFLNIFSGKNDHMKIQKQTIKCTFSPLKSLKLHERNKKHAVYLWYMNGKKEKGINDNITDDNNNNDKGQNDKRQQWQKTTMTKDSNDKR